MKKAIKILAPLLAVLILIIPFLTVFGVIFMTPSQHSNLFHGELNQKVERLRAITDPKIVVIGGSSVAFGLDSALAERYLGMPVVNFGLYGELGTKLMLDLAEDAIGEGDIVIVAPELAEQTLSLYFNARSTWLAFDDDPMLVSRLDRSDLSSMVGAAWGFSASKLSYLLKIKDAPNPDGIYNARNFDAYGDFRYVSEQGEDLRATNIMAEYAKPEEPIASDISAYADEFIDYLNDFAKRLSARGATVFYGWCPMNALAVSTGDGVVGFEGELPYERIAALESALAERLDFEILGHYADYAYSYDHFYDTNFHLNTAGANRHTANLVRDLGAALGRPTEVADADLLALPYLPSATPRERAEVFTVGDFLLRVQASGKAFEVVGLSEVGKTKETVVLAPMTCAGLYHERPVTAIAAGAFAGEGTMKTLVVGPIEGFSSLGAGAYADSSVRNIYIYAAPGTFGSGGIRTGAENLMIHFAEEHYDDFVIDYAWEGVFLNSPDLQRSTSIPFEKWLSP